MAIETKTNYIFWCNLFTSSFNIYFIDVFGQTREHWTGEVSADKWVPVFPVFNRPLVLWNKYFVFIKTTYSSRYSFIACNSRYA